MGLKNYTAKATDISKMNVFGGAVFPFFREIQWTHRKAGTGSGCLRSSVS